MIAILIGRQDDPSKKNKEVLSVKSQGGHIYRDTLGQQFAVFEGLPTQVAETAEQLKLSQIPSDWVKVN